MKFIHCSDIHLGARPEAGKPWAEARMSEIWDTFGRIVAMCGKENVDLLIISGDLFDRQPTRNELRLVNEMFASMKSTKVVLMAGNHDCISPRSLYGSFVWNKNVFMLAEREVQELYLYGLDTTVYGFSYHESQPGDALYRDVVPKKSSGLHILVAHGGDNRTIPIDFDRMLQAGFDYVALGHARQMKRFADNMYYPGTPEPLDHSETGEHGVIMGEFKMERGEYSLTTRFVPMACKKYIDLHIRVGTEDNNSSVAKRIMAGMLENGAGNFYTIFLEGMRRPELVFDTGVLGTKGMITEVIDNTVLDINYNELYEENKDNIIGQFMEKLHGRYEDESLKDRALYYGVEALLGARAGSGSEQQ